MVLDEVDAPLDDANLGRFLRLLDSLRARTQVIVITHQKRTMERADTLIGVTLNPDGSSRVVTQRLREHTEHVTSSEPVPTN
jgi:chromosome segregation protein